MLVCFFENCLLYKPLLLPEKSIAVITTVLPLIQVDPNKWPVFGHLGLGLLRGVPRVSPVKHHRHKYKTCLRMHGVPCIACCNRTQLGLLIGKVYGEI